MTAPPTQAGVLLDAVARLFDTYIFGPDRRRQIARYLAITGGAPGAAHVDEFSLAPGERPVLTRAPDVDFDLARVPSPQVRRLLDAFTAEIHYDPKQGRVRIAVGVSSLLYPYATNTSLGLVVPDDWPQLNPEAAHALLRLLTHIADARTARPHPRSTT